MNFYKYLIVLLAFLFHVSCSMLFVAKDYDLPITGSEISRTEGVAPFSVHFLAGYEKSTDKMGNFHNLSYEWDFDDSTSGNWGTTGLSRNRATGPVTAHVFEEPGNYSVRLSVRNGDEVISQGYFNVTVLDPDDFYAGDKTLCVSSSGNFTGAPAGAIQFTTSDLSEIFNVDIGNNGSIDFEFGPGKRILFRRGDEWTSSGIDFPDNEGPVTIGAFGAGSNPDNQGLFQNAPIINMTGSTFCDLGNKQDWRISDLHLIDPAENVQDAFGGYSSMQRMLIMNMRIEGFSVAISWGHWNESDLMTIDHMMVVNNHVSGSDNNCVYIGSERIALLGNIIRNSGDSHVARVWQSYRGVISNNLISGSSLGSSDGRHALKLHGPGDSLYEENEHGTPVPYSPLLEKATQETVVSDNIFGSSGPWPVMIGPQDRATECEINDIIFERNKILSEYGDQNTYNISVSLSIFAKFATVRNNIFDGTESGSGGSDYTAIRVGGDNILTTEHVNIYNNTVYRSDNSTGDTRFAFSVGDDSSDINIKNNLVSFKDSNLYNLTIQGSCNNLVVSNNLTTNSPNFVNPDLANPLIRDFSLNSGAEAIDSGAFIPLTFDFKNSIRKTNSIDIGAFEY